MPRTCFRLALSAFVLTVAAIAGAAPRTLTYTDILHQLTDLDRLTRLDAGVKGGLYSSWDRAGLTRWGANGDAGQYLRVEKDGEAVMMDQDGPGCIYRLWSANPMGKIRVYIDGDTKPTYEWSFPDLFTGSIHPFIKPLVWQRDGAQSASDCYLPIPFAKHIKVTADKKHGQYYQLNYLQFPKDWQVASFHLPLSDGEEQALAAAADAWSNPGRDPKPKLPDQQTITKTFTIHPGETVTLADLAGPGTVRAIRATVESRQRYYWRKLVLKGSWDDASWPQVLTPLGPFFGFDWDTAEYGSLIAGCQKGHCYFFYPMPFRESGVLKLISHLEETAKVHFEVEWAPLKELPADSLYFYARWRHEPDSMTFDYPFVETAGEGHFVGVTMPIDHPLPGWWGEGDEKVWVDDDAYPGWIGTGSEDYFGDAWGIRYLPGPSWGCSSLKDDRTCNYRWHFMDMVPFSKRFRMTIENYGPNGSGPRGHYDYSSTAFWYQKEKTPPFDLLGSAAYVGGDSPDAKPSAFLYQPDLFTDLDDSSLRTYGLAVPFAIEAEDVFARSVADGKGRVVTDALRTYQFSKERAIEFDRTREGERLAEGKISVPDSTAYFPKLYTAPVDKLAPVTLEIDGKRLEGAPGSKNPIVDLAGLYLTKGEHEARLVAGGRGTAIVDCLKLEPAAHESDVMEAEDAEVVSTTGGAPKPEPGPVTRAASSGRVLQWRATAAGQGVVLQLKKPAKPYMLGVRPMLGPNCGILQAFADGKPVGPSYDLYAPESTRGSEILPLGPVSPESGEIELRIVGRNPHSTGYGVSLDYFRWEPKVLSPNTSDRISARIIGVTGGEYRTQEMGAEWLGGHHLWVQPSSHNAVLEIRLDVSKEADYDLAARYTSSWDYATIQASLDDKPLAEPVDTYSADIKHMPETALGRVHLTAGPHILRFKAVSKNAESKGYLMGIDYVTVIAAP